MLLIPKIIPKKKYFHKLSYEGATKGHKKLYFGQFGLIAEKGAWISNKQIESVRKVLSRYIKNYGKIIINIFPHMPKTKKPLKVRMGSGKGQVEEFVAVVKKGTIMFEIKLTDMKYKELVHTAFKQAAYKLPIVCKTICAS